MEDAISRFHWADYLVTVATLAVSLGIGFFFAFFRGGQKTKAEYLLGNRQISMIPVCLSLFVTFQSAISLIGIPADTYNTGTMAMFVNYGMGLSYIIGYFTVVPVMYPLHLISVYEYLGMRFKSTGVRLFATCVGMFQTMLYMGVSLYAPALALQAAAGLPLWISVAVVGGIGTLYTAVGGIKSVVWTDAVQTLIVFFGIGAVLVKGILQVGGFAELFEIAREGGRIEFDQVNPDSRTRHSYWSTLIGACIVWLVNCFNQSTVQRIGSMKTLKDAKKAFLLNLPLQILYGSILVLTGLLLYAYVVTVGCDPHHAGLITNQNQMMPYFVIQVLSSLPGMAGIYMSMLFSGALSTVSSGINALAANTVEDLLARPLRGVRDTTVTVIAKVIVVIYGGVAIGLAYVMKSLSGPVTQLAVTAFGACGGPVAGMFILGGGIPWGNKYGAVSGGLIGLAVNFWLAIGSRLYGSPTKGLPPGPIHNCSALHPTAGDPFNLTVGYSYNVTSSLADQNYSSGFPDDNFETTTQFANTTWSSAPENKPFSIYDISYLWIGPIGMLVGFLSGIIVSCITGRTDPKSLDSKLIFPFCRKIFRMPEPVFKPEETSNSIAVKGYRQAWEKFKSSTMQMNIPEGDEENGQPFLSDGAKASSENLAPPS